METGTNIMKELSTEGKKVAKLPLDKIFPFRDHPFRVLDNEEMNELCESIKENGLLNPISVRDRGDGNYEIISGHRRTRACKRLGKEFIEAFIFSIDYNQAAVYVVDYNLQRKEILPSEYAHAYKMKFDALNALGYKGARAKIIEESENNSKTSINRYLALNKLCKDLLDLVDAKDIPIHAAEYLSNIRSDSQNVIARVISDNLITINLTQAQDLRAADKINEKLTYKDILDIILKDGRYEILIGRKNNRKTEYWGTATDLKNPIIRQAENSTNEIRRQESIDQGHPYINSQDPEQNYITVADPGERDDTSDYRKYDTPFDRKRRIDVDPISDETARHLLFPTTSGREIEMKKIDEALQREQEALEEYLADCDEDSWEEESFDDYKSIYAKPVSLYEARMMEQNNSAVKNWADHIVASLLDGSTLKEEDREILDKLLTACVSCNYRLRNLESEADDETDTI